MLRLAVLRVNPAEEAHLRSWLKEVGGPRRDEALVTLADEGCRHELALLVQTADGPIVVYAMEVEDLAKSQDAAATSRHQIDADHREVMSAAISGRVETEVLLDLRPCTPSGC